MKKKVSKYYKMLTILCINGLLLTSCQNVTDIINTDNIGSASIIEEETETTTYETNWHEEVDENNRVIKEISEDSEIVNTLGIKWGDNSTNIKKSLTERGFTVGDLSTDGYYMQFITEMQGRTWFGKLEFNDEDQLFGFSLRLAEDITDKTELKTFVSSLTQALYAKYGEPKIDTEEKSYEEVTNEIIDNVDEEGVHLTPYENHDVTCMLAVGRMDSNIINNQNIYNIFGYDEEKLKTLKKDINYYSVYIAYISANYSSNRTSEDQNLDMSKYDTVDSEVTPLAYYEDTDGKKILLNPEEYEKYDNSVNLDDYYVTVDWETGIKDSDEQDLLKASDMVKLIENKEKTIDDFTTFEINTFEDDFEENETE